MSDVRDEFISQKEAAELLGVHPRTILRAALERRITYLRTPGGWLRVKKSDVLEMLNPVERIVPETEATCN